MPHLLALPPCWVQRRGLCLIILSYWCKAICSSPTGTAPTSVAGAAAILILSHRGLRTQNRKFDATSSSPFHSRASPFHRPAPTVSARTGVISNPVGVCGDYIVIAGSSSPEPRNSWSGIRAILLPFLSSFYSVLFFSSPPTRLRSTAEWQHVHVVAINTWPQNLLCQALFVQDSS